jgi:hypothetical protein
MASERLVLSTAPGADARFSAESLRVNTSRASYDKESPADETDEADGPCLHHILIQGNLGVCQSEATTGKASTRRRHGSR